jgi:hypothetical protein
MRNILLLFCSVSMLLITGCESAEKFTASNIEAPVCPGIFITDCESNPEGTWMNPYSPSYYFPGSIVGTTLECSAYPNPDNGCITVSFPIPYNADAKITIVPALSPYEEEINSYTHFNSTYQISSGKPVMTLFDEELAKGYHSINWRGRDDDGKIVPDGFYRIYLEFDNSYLVWVDMFLGRDINNYPPGLSGGGPEW